MDSEKIMPLILLWIVWVIAAANIRGHFRNRRMTAYRRVSSENTTKAGSYPTTPAEHPISYWALLVFYWLAAVFVPAATLYLFLSTPDG